MSKFAFPSHHFERAANDYSSIRYYLNDRFRLRMEDTKLEEIMDEEEEFAQATAASKVEQPDDSIKTVDYAYQFSSPNPVSASVQPASDLNSENTKASRANGEYSGDEIKVKTQTVKDEHKTEIRALNGEIVDDEFLADALNYEFLMEKIDFLLEKLKLDA